MDLTSPAFENGQTIPDKYTCKGADISPELYWDDAPDETESFTLIAEDPDAPGGTYTHWVAYNIPLREKHLNANLPQESRVDGFLQGENDFGKSGYGGPCPPRGHGTHRYFFRLFALDTALDLPPGASKAAVAEAMKDHVLAEAELMGTYEIS